MSKQKFPEAEGRIFHRMFICMKCGAHMRADTMKVKEGRIKCRKCNRKSLRTIRKERKA